MQEKLAQEPSPPGEPLGAGYKTSSCNTLGPLRPEIAGQMKHQSDNFPHGETEPSVEGCWGETVGGQCCGGIVRETIGQSGSHKYKSIPTLSASPIRPPGRVPRLRQSSILPKPFPISPFLTITAGVIAPG